MKKHQLLTNAFLLLTKLKKTRTWYRITFISLGIVSTTWFLLRVIPKPSRASYPCLRAAAPIMSGFVVYILSIIGSAFAFKKFRNKLANANYLAASAFFVAAFLMIAIFNLSNQNEAKAFNLVSKNYFTPNNPIGTASGIIPGRVVWVWDQDATDENFTPSNSIDNWWANFTNKEIVDMMLRKAVTRYTDMNSIPEAWEALFKYYNKNHGKGDVGYTHGEKIYIKINLTNSSYVSGTKKTNKFDHMDSTPEVLLALLKQLVEDFGIDQSDIYVGDPFRTFHDLYWDMLHTAFPGITYCDGVGLNGRHKTIPSANHIIFFSDGLRQYRIPQEYLDSEYLINVPCLKTHDSAGITLGAKNHQGSILQDGASTSEQSAYDMHYALPDNDFTKGGHHRYRHLVDYLGHEQLGGKTLITIIDGIWAGRSSEGFIEKWNSAPFNGDYPSSLFISQDRVAIDAVCYDFLLEEYKDRENKEAYAYMEGTDDYLNQAADPTKWAEGISYDPEGDGTIIGSLGVYEHWNNATDKKYSRNLRTGNGIELVALTKSDVVSVTDLHSSSNLVAAKIFPNPAKDNVLIQYNLSETCHVTAEIFNTAGKRMVELFNKNEIKGNFNFPWNVKNLNSGNYLLQLSIHSKEVKSVSTVRFNVQN